jgi:type I phosphodiesterase/nucleotide pyrophosphatase/endonuclease/exonuclease/phosphatase family protein
MPRPRQHPLSTAASRLRTAGSLAAGLALALGASLAAVGPSGDPGAAAPADLAPVSLTAAARTATQPTAVRLATFNVLGFGHTEPGGDQAKRPDGRTRMVWATRAITSSGVGLVGFQELEPPQFEKFTQLMPSWSLWPTPAQGGGAQANSIAWDTSVWTAVVQTTYQAPYFRGTMQLRPLLQLRNNVTGQLVWVLNTHNPANTYGNAQAWRDQSERIQADVINSLRSQQPQVPVVMLGDMNDREKFYCPMTYLTELESASGGVHGDPPDGSCTPAAPVQIDWIMGTPDVTFTGYTARRDALVKKASDHPFIYADASIASQAARAANVKRVVLIDVEGMPSAKVRTTYTPTLVRLREHGASTLNARSAVGSRASLPNTVSILTGRSVQSHKATSSRDTGRTLRGTAGQYVSGVFDIAHNLGLSTALYSGDTRAAMLVRSWNAKHGGPDSYGRDNGRSKFTTARVSSKDSTVVKAARKRLSTHPTRLTVVQLSGPAQAAKATRFGSKQYVAALRLADRRVAGIMRSINANPATKGTTLVIVTSSASSLPKGSPHYGLPLIVRGPGVRHADLYALNPAYANPGSKKTGASGVQPIRTGVIANLVTTALLVPKIPRSTYNVNQDFNVFVDPTVPEA